MSNKNKKSAAEDANDVNNAENGKEGNMGGEAQGKGEFSGDSASLSIKFSSNRKGKAKEDASVSIAKSKVVLIKKLLANMQENYDKLMRMLAPLISEDDEERIAVGQLSEEEELGDGEKEGEGRVIEGVFDGENMIGPDGKQYSVPANYASKSKLVEGDILKLVITGGGTFIYKQISPIERSRVIGKLEKGGDGSFRVVANGKKWRVLTASITYFKGDSGDETVILVPKTGESRWAAVENIVKSR